MKSFTESIPDFLKSELHKCFVIAEAGVNHNGCLETAKRLVEAAAESGADAVKFQTWVTEEIVTTASSAAEYQVQNSGETSQYRLLKDLELPFEAFRTLEFHAKEVGIQFLSTPDDPISADFLVGMGMPVLKVGSGELTNLPFLAKLASYRRPLIVSTGMSTLDEVAAAVRVVRDSGNPLLALLHCVSSYPAEAGECNLRAMDTLAREFGLPVGFSDHTMGSTLVIAAVARGARIIEKHLTLDRSMPGPDHSCSADPAEFTLMMRAIREVEAALGDGVKRPSARELETLKVVRKEAVAARALPAGHVLTVEDITLKRGSGSGLPPAQCHELYGRKLAHPHAGDEALNFKSLADA